MKRAVVWLALLGCVPSTRDLTPAGAVGFALMPSDATRGAPFETSDGYVVSIDAVVILLDVSASPSRVTDEDLQGGSDTLLFSASAGEPVYVPGVTAGEAAVSLYFSQLYLDEDPIAEPVVDDAARPYLPRFERPADLIRDYGSPYAAGPPLGPSLLIAFHATGHGRAYQGSVTLDVDSAGSNAGPPVTVKANALQTVPLPVRAELLFMDIDTCGTLCPGSQAGGYGSEYGGALSPDEVVPSVAPQFAAFALADADDDGTITGAELREASLGDDALPDLLRRRAGRIFARSE